MTQSNPLASLPLGDASTLFEGQPLRYHKGIYSIQDAKKIMRHLMANDIFAGLGNLHVFKHSKRDAATVLLIAHPGNKRVWAIWRSCLYYTRVKTLTVSEMVKLEHQKDAKMAISEPDDILPF